MTIQKNKVVSIDYVLKDNDGNLIDSSKERGPLNYLHGTGGIIPGLEEALEGKKKGDNLVVSVPPEKAYGSRNESLLQSIPKSRFPEGSEIKRGMQFHASGNSGNILVTVIRVEEQSVVVDGNHPLAGVTLNFNVDVVDIREATSEEIDHGHVHGPGEHQH